MGNGLSIRGVTAATLHAWRRDFLYVTLLAGLVQLPIVAIDVWVFGSDGVSFSSDDTADHWVVALVITASVMLTHHLLAGVLEELEGAERHGHPRPTVGRLLRSLPWARLVIADLLLAVIIVAGVVAFLLPGLVLASMLSLVMPLLNLERQRVWPTFRRSLRLTRPHVVTVCVIWLSAQFLVGVGAEMLGRVMHLLGHGYVLTVSAHLFPEALLLPLGALPAVIMTYVLVDAEAAAAPSSPDRRGRTSETAPNSETPPGVGSADGNAQGRRSS